MLALMKKRPRAYFSSVHAVCSKQALRQLHNYMATCGGSITAKAQRVTWEAFNIQCVQQFFSFLPAATTLPLYGQAKHGQLSKLLCNSQHAFLVRYNLRLPKVTILFYWETLNASGVASVPLTKNGHLHHQSERVLPQPTIYTAQPPAATAYKSTRKTYVNSDLFKNLSQ
jgi:hypothetical protein